MSSRVMLLWLFGLILTNAGAAGDATRNPHQAVHWTPAEREVWELIEDWNRAFADNDPDRYFDFVAEEITVLTPSNPYRVEGKPDDREEFEFGIRMGYSRIGVFQEMTPLVRVYGDTAVVTYFSRGYYGDPAAGGAMAFLKETDVLRRIDGRWQIVHIHVSK